MSLVFDACALIAFLKLETGADTVRTLISEEETCLVHAVNLCEVYYYMARKTDETTALAAIGDIESLGLKISEELSGRFWQRAGQLKIRHALPLGDSFALALALWEDAELVTSDHGDFDPIAQQGICSIRFIR